MHPGVPVPALGVKMLIELNRPGRGGSCRYRAPKKRAASVMPAMADSSPSPKLVHTAPLCLVLTRRAAQAFAEDPAHVRLAGVPRLQRSALGAGAFTQQGLGLAQLQLGHVITETAAIQRLQLALQGAGALAHALGHGFQAAAALGQQAEDGGFQAGEVLRVGRREGRHIGARAGCCFFGCAGGRLGGVCLARHACKLRQLRQLRQLFRLVRHLPSGRG